MTLGHYLISMRSVVIKHRFGVHTTYLPVGRCQINVDSRISCSPLVLCLATTPTPNKTWILVESEYHQIAKESFQGTGVYIPTEVLRHLCAASGSSIFVEAFILNNDSAWVTEVNRLTEFAQCHPKAATLCSQKA